MGILNCSICHVEYQGKPPSAVLKSQLLVVLGCNKSSWINFFSLCFEPHMLSADTIVLSSIPTIPSLAASWNGFCVYCSNSRFTFEFSYLCLFYIYVFICICMFRDITNWETLQMFSKCEDAAKNDIPWNNLAFFVKSWCKNLIMPNSQK